jgi:hypothetical protein
MPEGNAMSLEAQGIPLLPLRQSIFAFTMDEHGFRLVCGIIDYWQTHYGMTLAEAVERMNERLGARHGYPPADVTADSLWFHDTMEHIARVMIEGYYWVKKDATA